MSWGSCQYDEAEAIYYKLQELFEQFKKQNSSDNQLADPIDALHQFLDFLGVKYDDMQDDFNEDELFKILKLQVINDTIEFYAGWEDGDGVTFKEFLEDMKRINDATNVEQVFEHLKAMSWDLWSAAMLINGILFEVSIDNPEILPGASNENRVGPVLNILAQSENPMTGLICFVANAAGWITNEESFSDFDT